MIEPKDLRDWLFRGLMFEAEAERFRAGGIRVGANTEEAERELFAETLAPFGVDVRGEAMRMARLYSLIYCFEGAVRTLITERMLEKHGAGWWVEHVPKKVQEFAAIRQKDSQQNSWLEGASTDILGFIQFGHLADIIIANWDDFSDLVPTQHWLKQRLDELERARNFIAHNRYLLPAEFQRIEMYVKDWNRMVGL
jgi:hypothetical protein